METPEKQNGGPTLLGGDSKSSTRSPRATKAEMNRRAGEVLKMMKKEGKVTTRDVAKGCGLTLPQTVTLLNGMVEDGFIVKAGRDNRRRAYRLPTAVVENVTELAPAKLPVELGDHLEVVGITWTKDGLAVNVKEESGKELVVSLG